MRLQHLVIVAVVSAWIGWTASSSFGEDQQQPTAEELLQMMEEMGKPGPMHDHIRAMEGSWSVDVKVWEGAPEPTLSKARVAATSIMGGRFLQNAYDGQMFGRPYKGFGLIGYNNNKKQYESVWVDNFNSQVSYTTGQASPDGKTLTFEGMWEGPNDMKSPYRTVYAFANAGFTITSFARHDGAEVREMELAFTRTGAAPPAQVAPSRQPVAVTPRATRPALMPAPAATPTPAPEGTTVPTPAHGGARFVPVPPTITIPYCEPIPYCPPRPCRPRWVRRCR